MPQLSAASSRDRPSKTSAIASIRRAALASRVRAAARRKSPADRSRRVIATAMSASAPGQWRSESRRRHKRGHVRVIGQGAWYQSQQTGRDKDMADLLVIAYPTEAKAEEVRSRMLGMQQEYLIELGDAVVAVKQADGQVK